MDWAWRGEAGWGWNDRRRDIAAPGRCLPGPTTTDTHPSRSASFFSRSKLLFLKSNEVCSTKQTIAAPCRRKRRRVKWNRGRKSKRFHLRRRLFRRHGGLERGVRNEHGVEAGRGAVRGMRSDETGGFDEAPLGKVRCRLRRPEGWHVLEGRAERECGLPSRSAAVLHGFRRRNLLTAGTEWNGVKGALRLQGTPGS